jgi:hypothetical protein
LKHKKQKIKDKREKLKEKGLIGIYINLSNLSFLALQIGQTPGGSSMAQRYPQNLHLHTVF